MDVSAVEVVWNGIPGTLAWGDSLTDRLDERPQPIAPQTPDRPLSIRRVEAARQRVHHRHDQAIADALTREPGLRLMQIARHLHIGTGAAHAILARLQRERVIEKRRIRYFLRPPRSNN